MALSNSLISITGNQQHPFFIEICISYRVMFVKTKYYMMYALNFHHQYVVKTDNGDESC